MFFKQRQFSSVLLIFKVNTLVILCTSHKSRVNLPGFDLLDKDYRRCENFEKGLTALYALKSTFIILCNIVSNLIL